jgi:hypothetical protein
MTLSTCDRGKKGDLISISKLSIQPIWQVHDMPAIQQDTNIVPNAFGCWVENKVCKTFSVSFAQKLKQASQAGTGYLNF